MLNFVLENTNTTGSGETLALTGAVSNEYLSFDDALANPIGGGSGPSTWNKFTVQYVIEDGNNRELGYGIYERPSSFRRRKAIESLYNGEYTALPTTFMPLSGSAIIGVGSGGVNNLCLPTFSLLRSDALWLGDDNREAYLTYTTSSTSLGKDFGVGNVVQFAGPKKISGMGVSLSSAANAAWSGHGDKIHAALFEVGVADPNLGGFLFRKVFDEVDPTLDLSASAGPRHVSLQEPVWVPPGTYLCCMYIEDSVEALPSFSVSRRAHNTPGYHNQSGGFMIISVTEFLTAVQNQKVHTIPTTGLYTIDADSVFIYMV